MLPAIRRQGFFGATTAGQQIALRNQKIKLLEKLETKDAFVSVLTSLRNVCNLLGEPMPDPALVERNRHQLGLEVYMLDMDPHTAMNQCRVLVRAIQGLALGGENHPLEITGDQLSELLVAVDDRIATAITALEKEGQETATPKAEVEDLDSEATIVIEPKARLQVSTAYARKLAGAVREAGYRCDTISAARPMSSGSGYQLACNRFSLGYDIDGENGLWTVMPD